MRNQGLVGYGSLDFEVEDPQSEVVGQSQYPTFHSFTVSYDRDRLVLQRDCPVGLILETLRTETQIKKL